MKWSEIDSAFGDLKENLDSVGTRIETAKRHHGQIHHANHKPWYTFESLDAQLQILRDTSIDVSKLEDAYIQGRWRLRSLGIKIRRRKEEEFDVFTAHRKEVSIDRKLCFVMIPFAPAFNPVYSAIRRAVTGKGLKCERSKDVFDTRAVILDIWEKIRKSVVCIAEASPPNNPNVFYEIGMAHALPKRVIIISRKLKPDEKYPFDVNYIRYIPYQQTAFGYRQLEQDISRTLRTVLQ